MEYKQKNNLWQLFQILALQWPLVGLAAPSGMPKR
jgi:hypothetical protein